MVDLLLRRNGWSGRFGWRRQAFDSDRPGFGAAVKTSPATGTVFAGVLRRMHTVMVELGRQFKTLRRTRIYTQAASFTFFGIDDDITARLG
jgi:hypothetical protein